VPVAPNRQAAVPVAINSTEWTRTPALGLMVVVEDNTSGERQANLIQVGSSARGNSQVGPSD
jgi:hypothetical protein